jgi:hypothetical protein
MKSKLVGFLYPTLLFAVPILVDAQSGLEKLISDTGDLINKVIPVLIGLAVLAFLWGVVQFIFSSEGPQKADAKQFMVWGLIALFVMVSVWGLVRILSDTLGIRANEVPRLPVIPTR